MAWLYLVRHGRAAAGFGESHNPGLDEVGREQAETVAQELAPRGPLPILTSPLRRTRETATSLAAVWRVEPRIEDAVAEIPSPTDDLQERVAWLRQFMAGSWRNATMDLAAWREDVIATLLAIPDDSVVFTHFIAINVAVGGATGDDRVVAFSPENCSVTIVESDGGTLRLIEKGREAQLTKVN